MHQISGQALSLEEAVATAAARAASVWMATAQQRTAAAEVERERGRFDPELFVDLDRSAVDEPSASPFSGADVVELDQTRGAAGVSVKLPSGTELEASLVAVRQETNSIFAALDPQYTATGQLRFSQPLLEGFAKGSRRNLTSAEQRLEAATARREQAERWARARAEILYWDLYAATRDLAVQMLLRDRADALLKEVASRTAAGLVGPVEVANARLFLATQELALIDRREELDARSDGLAAFIDARPGVRRGAHRYQPVDHPPAAGGVDEIDAVGGEVNGILAAARRHNPSLAAARAEIAALKTLAAAAGHSRAPSLRLTGALGGNGIAGAGQPVVFGADTTTVAHTGGLADALSSSLSGDFPSWEVGLQLRLPLGNRTDRGEHRRLLSELDRIAHAYDKAQRNLDAEVRAHCRTLANGAERLAAAQAGVEAANEQVRIGLIEYDHGRSTAFELVRLGADLAAAQQTYSKALVHTARARANLRYLTAGHHPAAVDGGGGS